MARLLVLTFLSLVAFCQAANLGNTAQDYVGVQTGNIFTIKWSNAVGPVTLLLKNGEANALKTVSTIASGLTGTSYSWSIPSTLPTDYYAFEIDDNGSPNYSVRFLISGGPSITSSTTSSTPVVKTSSTSSTTLSSSASPSAPKTSPTVTSTTSSVTAQQSSTSSSSTSPSTSQTSLTSSSTTEAPSSTASSSLTNPNPTSTPSSASASASASSSTSSSLSPGTKAAIGTGATLGVLLIAGLGFLLFWFGKRSAARKSHSTPTATDDTTAISKAELGAGTPLNDTEKIELQDRRRAAELDSANAHAPVEVEAGAREERAELEARRKGAKERFEMS